MKFNPVEVATCNTGVFARYNKPLARELVMEQNQLVMEQGHLGADKGECCCERFESTAKALHDVGAELMFPTEEDDNKTLEEIENRGPATKEEIAGWIPSHDHHQVLFHFMRDDKASLALLKQLHDAGTRVVYLEDPSQHSRTLAEVKERNPIVSKILDDIRNGPQQLCGHADWPRWTGSAT